MDEEEMMASLDIQYVNNPTEALKNEVAIVDREMRQSLLYCLAEARSEGLI